MIKMSNILNFAVLGNGFMGKKHIEIIKSLDTVRLSAVIDHHWQEDSQDSFSVSATGNFSGTRHRYGCCGNRNTELSAFRTSEGTAAERVSCHYRKALLHVGRRSRNLRKSISEIREKCFHDYAEPLRSHFRMVEKLGGIRDFGRYLSGADQLFLESQ